MLSNYQCKLYINLNLIKMCFLNKSKCYYVKFWQIFTFIFYLKNKTNKEHFYYIIIFFLIRQSMLISQGVITNNISYFFIIC